MNGDDPVLMEQARNFLLWIADPAAEAGFGGLDVLEQVATPVSIAAINARGEEGHLCLLCGGPAVIVFVLSPPVWEGRAAWLDACMRCGWAVRTAAESIPP